MLLSTPTISQHLHEDRNCSGFLKIHIDFSARGDIIGIYRKRRRRVHAKTATVPSDLWRTASRYLLPQRVREYRADPADAGRVRGHSVS